MKNWLLSLSALTCGLFCTLGAAREGASAPARIPQAAAQDERLSALRRDERLAQAYVERHRSELLAALEPSDSDLRARYSENPDDFVSPPSFTARHLLVLRAGRTPEEARRRAEAARLRRLEGASWDDVAREFSDDVGTRRHGGLLHESPWGLLPRAVEAVVRTAPLAEPCEVIESEFGYHLVEVEQRSLEPTRRPFEEVRERLRQRLVDERQAESHRRLLARWRAALGVVVSEAGKSEAHLAVVAAIPGAAVLASVGTRNVSEAELRCFVDSTVPASERQRAFARPHARTSFLTSYLDLVVLAEMARREGLSG